MMRPATWLWLLAALGLGFALFQLKYQVQSLEQQLAHINRQILASEEAIHVLKAEWSYLNQPERIDALSRKHLGLQPLTGKQYGTLDDLPERGNAVVSAPEHPERSAPSAAPPAAPLRPLPAERPRTPKGVPGGGHITLAREVQ